jgi:hypothetical protein
MNPTVSGIRVPLGALVECLQILDKLTPGPKVSEVAGRAIGHFLGRYDFVLEAAQRWGVGPFETYLIGEVTKLVSQTLAGTDVNSVNWYKFVSHFYPSDNATAEETSP